MQYHGELFDVLFKKNLNAAKPPEQSKGLGGIKTLAVRAKTIHGIKGVPQHNHIIRSTVSFRGETHRFRYTVH